MSEAQKTTPKAAQKSAEKAADSVAGAARETMTDNPFQAFQMSHVEVPEMLREATEKGVRQAREGYERMRNAAEETTDLMEDSFETSRQGLIDINTAALKAAKANTDATFSFAEKAFAVTSASEFVALQTAFVRKQLDAALSQTRDIQEIATRVATDSARPAREAMTRTMKTFKTA